MGTKQTTKVPVGERALLQRLNRALAKEYQVVRKSRRPESSDLGEYYVVDVYTNTVVDSRLNLETYARDAGALREWEEVADGRALLGR